ncbi:MAG: hydantoinase B/oxoprolinase family protein [Arhodomonas sp.]|nr:hydantoinase B/oxoprolinase family protein [Arhodomonas sp.]
MGVVLMKTSYSTIFNEALDFTCGLADMNGDMIAVADYCPAQIGGMPLLVKSCLKEIALEDLEEGDIIVHNDPYPGGLHTPEHTFFKPIFVEGESWASRWPSATSPRSVAWSPADSPARPPRSSRRVCAYRRSRSARPGRTTSRSGNSSRQRRGRRGATTVTLAL